MNMTPAGPTVFIRTISTPPGLPWEQARMADIDARAGAPLPLAEVVYRLGRLEPWRPGGPGRYFACYVRAREVGERLLATATVEGRPIALEFVSGPERTRRLRRIGVLAAVAGGSCVVALGGFGAALAIRADAADRMARIEASIDIRMRQALRIRALKVQALALEKAGVRGQDISDFLNDLAWMSRSRSTAAHIDAVHWDHGYLGVETRGDTPPFSQIDRPVVKAEKPVRPYVWLWGIGRSASTDATAPTTGREH